MDSNTFSIWNHIHTNIYEVTMWQLNELFTDFFFKTELHSIDNKKLSTECLSYFKENKSVELSNVGGLQSQAFHLRTVPKELELYKLAEEVQSSLHTLSSQNNYTTIQLQNFWINVNYENNYNDLHVHPRSTFSLVYYVNVPDNTKNYLQFRRMDDYIHYMDGLYHGEDDKYHALLANLSVNTGDLVCFPSYLWHKTDMNPHQEPRISIAFNTDIFI